MAVLRYAVSSPVGMRMVPPMAASFERLRVRASDREPEREEAASADSTNGGAVQRSCTRFRPDSSRSLHGIVKTEWSIGAEGLLSN